MSISPRVWALLPSRVLAWLCHVANSDVDRRELFYPLKNQLLVQYGTFEGMDLQEIVKPCWGDWGTDCGPNCRRCGGSGVYSRFWVYLQRWKWGMYTFHIPVERVYLRPNREVTITGYVEHRDYGRGSREAELWLYLVTLQFMAFRRAMKGGWYCTPGWWPLCRLQNVCGRISAFISSRKCWCGRRFITWGSGWQICRSCRNRKSDDRSTLPF